MDNDDLKPCPFCGGDATETQKGSNYVIVRCESLRCSVRPSAVCYDSGSGYDFTIWNRRAPITRAQVNEYEWCKAAGMAVVPVEPDIIRTRKLFQELCSSDLVNDDDLGLVFYKAMIGFAKESWNIS